MPINAATLNTDVVNNLEQIVPSILLSFEQEVVERLTGEGTLLSFEQRVLNSQPGYVLLALEQRVVDEDLNTFYLRNGWEPIITMAGETITASILTGEIVVIKQEDDNHLAVFNIILRPNIYNLYGYQGAYVTIDVRKANITRRVFTGYVDIPVVDVINEKLTINCVADRRKLLFEQGSLEPYIGVYSEAVLGQNNDVYERINARLQTIPSALDFDSYNQPSITSWVPKASADFNYGSGDVYRRDPQLSIESSAKIVNQVNLTIEYGYQRLHHRQNLYFWAHPYAPLNPSSGTGGICGFLEDQPSMPTKEMIQQAADAAGWPAMNFSFGKQFLSGSYNCNGAWVQWSTMETSGINAAIVDGSGNPVLDANGNQLTRSVTTVVADNTDLYTMNAQWIASTQFNQNIKESYYLTVNAPLSQNRYGILSTVEGYGYTDASQYEEWENYEEYRDPPAGATLLPVGNDGTYYINGDANRNTFNAAILCALAKANTTILRSHRDTTITLQRDLTPEIELRHTVALTGKWVRGKGKCKRIEHHMSITESSSGASGECYTALWLAQFRGVGTTTASSLVVPAGFNDAPTVNSGVVNLQTHLGEDPSQNGSENWDGYVGNVAITEQVPPIPGSVFPGINYTRTYYQESFIVNTPAIDDQYRSERNLTKAVNYAVNIPTDDTEYQSYG